MKIEIQKIKNLKITIQETEEAVDFGDFVNEVINFEEGEPEKRED